MEELRQAETKANSEHIAVTEDYLHEQKRKYCPIKDGYCNDNCMFWMMDQKKRRDCMVKQFMLGLFRHWQHRGELNE